MPWQPTLILFFLSFAALSGLYIGVRALIENRALDREMASRIERAPVAELSEKPDHELLGVSLEDLK